MIIQLVRYKAGISHQEVMERFENRVDQYRRVPGLLQKYYVHFAATDEHGGVYVWDSTESMEQWRKTNLADTLAETYRVEGPPDVEIADVMLVLRPESVATGK